ncbi:hypothetical protein EsHS_00003137 [Epichloe bromicola]
MPSPSLSGTSSNPTSGGGLDPSANSRTIDFAGNFLASPAWEARILTPLSNPNVNYTFDTGEHFVTIQIQSWLRQNPEDSMGGSGGSGGRMAGESNSLGGGGGGGGGGSSSSSYAPQPGDYMRLRIEWTKQQGSPTKGSSTSGLFTVADSVEGVSDKWSRDIVQGFDNDKLNGTMPPPARVPLPKALLRTTPEKAAASSSLSTGAIAGIAVGCGIGLILGGTALAWFFMTRRRRRQHSSRQGCDAHDKATALIDDNRNSVANVAASPQPPRPEDKIIHDSSRHAHQPVHSAAGVPPRGQEAARNNRDSHCYPPLAQAVSLDVVEERGESWRDAPSRAANFAERGMTDDERRRWEEEERRLDDEIARNKAV